MKDDGKQENKTNCSKLQIYIKSEREIKKWNQRLVLFDAENKEGKQPKLL